MTPRPPHPQRCDNGCRLFEAKPGKLDPDREQPGDWIGWCHLNDGHLLVLRGTYDLICFFGCASHSSSPAAAPVPCGCDLDGIIRPLPDCFGHWKGIDSDCNCHQWGYCADITTHCKGAAAKERERVLDHLLERLEMMKGHFQSVESLRLQVVAWAETGKESLRGEQKEERR